MKESIRHWSWYGRREIFRFRCICAMHLQLMKQLGYGKDYKYAHAYKGNFVKQDFLPEEIRTQRIWHAQDNPSEQKLKERMVSLWGDRFKE